jgi:hypothetical protein
MGNKLTARAVEAAGPGRHSDGVVRGLMLLVQPRGSRSWMLRYQVQGRRRDLGLGSWPEITLARAREKALEARRLVVEGRDPLAEPARSRIGALTFRKGAEALIESKRSGWRNAKHAAQWGSTLATYAYPKLGDLDVRNVDTASVLQVLRPIWTEKPETASRLRQRIEAVLDYARALGARSGENPARWRGHLDHLLPKPSKVRAVEHHPALDWREAPAFVAELAAIIRDADCRRRRTRLKPLRSCMFLVSRQSHHGQRSSRPPWWRMHPFSRACHRSPASPSTSLSTVAG